MMQKNFRKEGTLMGISRENLLLTLRKHEKHQQPNPLLVGTAVSIKLSVPYANYSPFQPAAMVGVFPFEPLVTFYFDKKKIDVFKRIQVPNQRVP